jgi:hypothetical protein
MRIQYDGFDLAVDLGDGLKLVTTDATSAVDGEIATSPLPADWQSLIELKFQTRLDRGAHNRYKSERIQSALIDTARSEDGKNSIDGRKFLDLCEIVLTELCTSHTNSQLQDVFDEFIDLKSELGPVVLAAYRQGKKKRAR